MPASTDDSIAILERRAGELAFWRSHRDDGQAARSTRASPGCAATAPSVVAVGWLNADDYFFPEACARCSTRSSSTRIGSQSQAPPSSRTSGVSPWDRIRRRRSIESAFKSPARFASRRRLVRREMWEPRRRPRRLARHVFRLRLVVAIGVARADRLHRSASRGDARSRRHQDQATATAATSRRRARSSDGKPDACRFTGSSAKRWSSASTIRSAGGPALPRSRHRRRQRRAGLLRDRAGA
jgi:hypothetical protein